MFTGSLVWTKPLRLFYGIILASGAWPARPQFTTLQPGVERQISQTLTINVVFVGYHQGLGPQNIKTADFLAQLPQSYHPILRSPAFYGIKKPLPLTFQYNYNVSFANVAFEDALFAYLGSIATPQPLTSFQGAYNSQAQRSRTVANNH